MSDKDLMVISTLEDIGYSINLILERFEHISSSDDFLENSIGLEKLDSISMRLIAIGEGFKQVDKITDNKLLVNYPNIEWKKVKGIRDILSHHYFDMDAEVIYNVCDEYLDALLETTYEILGALKIPNKETLKAIHDAEMGINMEEITLEELIKNK